MCRDRGENRFALQHIALCCKNTHVSFMFNVHKNVAAGDAYLQYTSDIPNNLDIQVAVGGWFTTKKSKLGIDIKLIRAGHCTAVYIYKKEENLSVLIM